MATAGHFRDTWRADFAALSTSFHYFTVLGEDFRQYAEWPTLEDYDRLAAASRAVTVTGRQVRFIRHAPRPRGRRRRTAVGVSYEQRVIDGAVPTRLGHWHDFFNMLVWCAFPKAKAALNARQVAGGAVVNGARNDEQNRLAMFDEGGVVIAQVGSGDYAAQRFVFGHAIHEGIMRGSPDAGGWTTVVEVNAVVLHGDLASLLAVVDAALAASISANALTRRTSSNVEPNPSTGQKI